MAVLKASISAHKAGVGEQGMEQKEAKRRTVGAQPVPLLFVIGSLDIGGAEGHLARIVPQLDRLVWAPAIYTFIRRGALAEAVERQGVPVYDATFPAFLRGRDLVSRGVRLVLTFAQLVRHLIRRKPRVVHYFLPASYLIGLPATFVAHALTAFAGPLPRRVMSRRSLNLYQRKYPILARLERLLHKGCNVVVGNSRAVIEELKGEGVSSECLELIYNGIEMPPVEARDMRSRRANLGLPEQAVIVTQVANLIPYKGHADLLDAFAKAQAATSVGMALCLVGRDDGIGAELAAKAEALGIADRVTWLGARGDVAAILAASDIGVLSSHQEGFSNAVLEGMAASLPMVVTRVGGNSEAVIDGETGLLVEPHNSDALAKALVRLADDAALRLRLGEAARRRVEDNFTLGRCADRYERLYTSLIGTGVSGPPDRS